MALIHFSNSILDKFLPGISVCEVKKSPKYLPETVVSKTADVVIQGESFTFTESEIGNINDVIL